MAVTLYEPIVFGDTDGRLGGRAKAAGQIISLAGDVGTRSLVGDASGLLGRAKGGADALTSFAMGATTVIGDAVAVGVRAHGGNDTVLPGASGTATPLGDAVDFNGRARGGDAKGGADALVLSPNNGRLGTHNVHHVGRL